MEGRISDFLLSLGIKVFHKMEKLTEKEIKAQQEFLSGLKISERKTKKPIIIGIVGLIGSGKTSIAKELAPLIGATVVSGDDIRILLRKKKEKYDNTRLISENAANEIIRNGGNVIMDSDFVDPQKRISLREKVKKIGVQVIFIRIHSEIDVIIGRIFEADYKNIPDDFFGGASSIWHGKNKGAVVKLREMYRRLPHHYRWLNESGGKWVLRKFPFKVFAEIDTTDENKWKREVKMVAGQIYSCY